jgi:hypothetical protein
MALMTPAFLIALRLTMDRHIIITWEFAYFFGLGLTQRTCPVVIASGFGGVI